MKKERRGVRDVRRLGALSRTGLVDGKAGRGDRPARADSDAGFSGGGRQAQSEVLAETWGARSPCRSWPRDELRSPQAPRLARSSRVGGVRARGQTSERRASPATLLLTIGPR